MVRMLYKSLIYIDEPEGVPIGAASIPLHFLHGQPKILTIAAIPTKR